MASRFGVDISDVGRGFQDLVQSWNLVGEQRRVQAEREAQSDQALLSLALAAGGAFIPGVSAVAGAQMGLGGAERVQRDDALTKFGEALSPADRPAAAKAAAGLGDIGTAARLAFPGGEGGTVNRQVVTVMGDNGRELRLLDKETAQFVGGSLGPAEGRSTTSGNTVQEIYDPGKEVTERIMFDKEGERIKTLGQVTPKSVTGKRTTVDTFDDDKKPITALIDTDEGKIVKTFPRKLKDSESGGARTATNAIDLVELQVKAAQQVARKSGKQDVLRAMAEAGTNVEALQKVGELNPREIEREYMSLLEAETKSEKPGLERAVAQKELNAF